MKRMLQLLARSKNGVDVVYDPIASHAATHFNDTPELERLAIEAIKNSDLE